jgi:broad specificity phosphatase PhoE
MRRPGHAGDGRPRTVWVVRHGVRRDFVDPSWVRSAVHPYDPPLARSGIAQSRVLSRRLRAERIAHVFSSPFLRALETAEQTAAVLDLRIKVEPGLSEWLSRAWFPQPPLLLSLDEAAQRFPRIDRDYLARGGAQYGESGDEALARAGRTARHLVDDFQGNLLLVGHGASVLGATAGLLDIDANGVRPALGDLPYGCVVKLARHGDTHWAIEFVTDAAHLRAASGEGA